MRFLSVAERELRAASRRKATYRARSITGAAFFVLLVWLIWAFDGFRNQRVAPQIFNVFAVLSFIYCLIVGTARTADCLSSERRDGTLGLLFLTNLNSAEIVAGKLCSNALPTVYGLLAIFPIMAFPLLMGGITFDYFGRTMLALLDAILFSLAAGFVASVFCKRQFTAVALAMTLAVVFGAGLFGGAAILSTYRVPRIWLDGLTTFCPLYTLVSAEGRKIYGQNHFWFSLAVVAGMSVVWLGLVTWQLARSWRDRPKSVRTLKWFKFQNPLRQRNDTARATLRSRLLNLNPFYWLAGRRPISSPVFMMIVFTLVLITIYGTAPYFARVIGAGAYNPVAGSLFAWLWTALAIHVLALYYAAMISSQRLAEDKEAGALELILSTPATERTISRGLWMAFARRMFFPALAAVLAQSYFIWQCMVMCTLDPPGEIHFRATPGQYFWAAVFNEPLGGQLLEWEFSLLIRAALMIFVLAVVLWITLGWLARWLGLRMKHPGFAPLVALAAIAIPPTLLFSLLCYFADKARLLNGGAQFWMPIMVCVAFGLVMVHCLLLCAWAAGKLCHDFRAVVIGRFDAKPRDWRTQGRMLLRFSIRATGFALALVLLGAGLYGCQNYRARRNWSTFQARLQQKGESLDLAPLLPPSVADEKNFARSREFQDLVTGKNKSLRNALNGFQSFVSWQPYYGQTQDTYAWVTQKRTPLKFFANCVNAKAPPDGATNNTAVAPMLLQALQPHEKSLAALATATRLPLFQLTTNRSARSVLQPQQAELDMLTRLHFLFTLRSIALLETSRTAEAGEDLLTSLRLAQLSRQSPDVRSTVRNQAMLTRSFQPLWEGLDQHQWSDAQLAAFQTELANFNLLADHTNAIHRTVLAHIEIWKDIPDSKASRVSLPSVSGGFTSNKGWQWQPRTWWFNHCIALHQLGETLIGQMDLTNECCQFNAGWSTLNSLPLDSETQQWLGQMQWYNANPAQVTVAQTWLNQARLAIALERQRITDGHYPKTLNQLMPGQLARIPNDVARGRPLAYELLGNDHYILRGFGFDRQSGRTNSVSDDWLWAYPTNAPAAATSP